MCIYVGRKKRRAARGRTDVGDQPYEDPNMQVSSRFLTSPLAQHELAQHAAFARRFSVVWHCAALDLRNPLA